MRTKLIYLAALLLAASFYSVAQNAATPPPAAQPPAMAQPTDKPSLQPASTTPPGFSEHNPRYLLRSGDVMELSFEFSPEFNQSVTVQPDGFINLRDIGDVHVAGQSVPQVRETIKSAYSKVLKDPVIAVVLRDFERPYFIAAGEVGKPGKYELRGDTTLTEAVAIAGGFDENSKHSRVILYHKVSNEWMEGKVVDVKKMMASRNLAEDIHLSPGDMVFVPKNNYSKFKRFIPSPGVGMGWVP